MDYQNYIKSELLILVPVLYIVGLGFKKSKIPDKWIPFILGITGIVLSVVWVIATTDIFGVQEIAWAIIYRRNARYYCSRCQCICKSALYSGKKGGVILCFILLRHML